MDEEETRKANWAAAMNSGMGPGGFYPTPTSIDIEKLSQMLQTYQQNIPKYGIESEPAEDISTPRYRNRMIGMRLRVPEGAMFPFDALETHYAGEKVFIFVVVDAKPVVFEDESSLFPSDALITQLRLIQK